MDTMSSMLSGYPCQARSQKECLGVTHVLSIERYMYTQAMTQGSQKLRKWMTLCNLRRQKTLLKDYSMRVKHQTDRLIKISGVAGADPGFFFRRGCTHLLLYFNTNKPHCFFFYRIPVVLEKRRSSQGGVHPLHPPPRSTPGLTIVL